MALPPRSMAEKSARAPLIFPMGVRAPATSTDPGMEGPPSGLASGLKTMWSRPQCTRIARAPSVRFVPPDYSSLRYHPLAFAANNMFGRGVRRKVTEDTPLRRYRPREGGGVHR